MRRAVVTGLALCTVGLYSAAVAAQTYQTPELLVVGVTPILGTGIDKDKLPANIQVIDPARDRANPAATAADMLNGRLGSVTATDYQGSPLQPSLSFRGFTASPLLGEPQGLAVYQNGMRLNEAFGDVVNWDLSPAFAVDTIQMLPGANPVFGLNALGGAVAMRMKTGFTSPGSSADMAVGSFGRARTTVETGRQLGTLGFYGGVSALTDDGWRHASPSKTLQSYTDFAVRRGDADLGVAVTLAGSDLSGNGPSPVQLLAADRAAVFTSPDQTRNTLGAVELRGAVDLSTKTAVQGGAYLRHLRTATHNGDIGQNQPCSADATVLCDGNDVALVSRSGGPVPASAGGSAVVNNTTTQSDGVGGSLQLSHDAPVAGRQNAAIVGLSADLGRTAYHTNTELGELSATRAAVGSGLYLGGADYNTGLETDNAYYGVFFTDTLSLTERLHLTAAGRFNTARVQLHDKLGTSLNGDHAYQRFNPSLGAAWQVNDRLTGYANYSEANRVPTAAELSCADASRPCRVPNAFLSDPDLKQVVSRTVEVGARGAVPGAGADKVEWSLAAFTTRNDDDIIFVSGGPVVGSGYFSNAGSTQRQGVEAGGQAAFGAWTVFANYGLVRATFDSSLTIRSPHNPAADSNGDVQVRPGARMPGIPLHSLKLGGSYAVTPTWSVAGDASATSSRYLRGDESNTAPKIGGFAVVNAGSTYMLTPAAQVYLRVSNVFDQKFQTAGALGDATAIFPSFADTRFESPGEPRAVWLGTRITF